MSDAGNAPSWLFSFVDLAFLLLIAMTQIASDDTGPDLGDIIVPSIEAAALAPESSATSQPWQLRVHPPSDADPFELIAGAPLAEGTAFERLGTDALRDRLRAVKKAGETKPLLAPHEDSRSQDLLDAVAALESQWPGRRRVAVLPLPGR